ncbi:MAG TPA: carboxypeptidase-like regulatory domain-containing protein, partial [Terracidiphilus sp.]|nr:carboxypeptidase-like regulatory domain-containing protein [Terracidiphilus sp.]
MWRARILTLLLVFVFSSCAFAQGGGNVAIGGMVMDPTGAVIANAKVTVKQKSTSVSRTTTTNGSGQFNMPSLPPTTYTVSVEATGFKQYVQDVVLLADQIRDMDIRMQVGDTTQQVTVEESAVAVNTVSPELSQVIESSRLVDIPLNGRNAADLTLAVPGAVS